MQGKIAALQSILDKLKELDANEVKMSIKRQPMGSEDEYKSPMMGEDEMDNEKEDEGIEISPEALAILSKLKR